MKTVDQSRSLRCRHGKRSALALTAAGMLAATGVAGASIDVLPGPMTREALGRHTARLALSDDQRTALDWLFDHYRRDTAALRDEAWQRLAVDLEAALEAPAPDPRDVASALTRRETLIRRVADLDDRLFERLASDLTPTQLERLPRARFARARQRTLDMGLLLMGVSLVDLSELCRHERLSRREQDAAEPCLLDYERWLTARIAEAHRDDSRAFVELSEIVAESGGAGDDPLEAEEAAIDTIAECWARVDAKSDELIARIRSYNRQTLRRLGAVLPPATVCALSERFYTTAYPVLDELPRLDGLRFDRPAWLDRLDPEQRAAVESIENDYGRAMVGLFARGADEIDARGEALRRGTLTAPDWEAFDARRQRDKERARALYATAQAQLVALVGDERTASLDGAFREKPDDGDSAGELALDDELGLEILPGEVGADHDGEPDGPGPLAHSEIAALAREIGTSEDLGLVLEMLHSDYRERFEGLRLTIRKAQRSVGEILWADEITEPSKTVRVRLDRAYATWLEAMDAMQALDDELFDAIESLDLGPEAPAAVARWRRATEGRVFAGSSGDAAVDLVDVIERAPIELPDDGALRQRLDAYRSSLVAARRTRLQSDLVLDHWVTWLMSDAGEGSAADMDRLDELQQASWAAAERIGLLNHDMLGDLERVLSMSDFRQIRARYVRDRFADELGGLEAASALMNRARQLDTLAPVQVERLDDLLAEHRLVESRLVDQLSAVGPEPGSASGDASTHVNTVEAEAEAAAEQVRRSLRSILTADQLARVDVDP